MLLKQGVTLHILVMNYFVYRRILSKMVSDIDSIFCYRLSDFMLGNRDAFFILVTEL